MKHDSLDQYEVPRDPELAEAFEAFIQQTHVPRDFHARVRARVQQRRSHHGHWGWSKRWWTWWTHDWSPLGVWAATVWALLSLACNLGLGYYTWKHRQAITTLGQERTATRAQMHQGQAEQHQLAALQQQMQREIQASAALRHELTTAQLQVHAAQAESHQWQDRVTELTHQLAALPQQAQDQTQHAQVQEPPGAPAPSTRMPVAVHQAEEIERRRREAERQRREAEQADRAYRRQAEETERQRREAEQAEQRQHEHILAQGMKFIVKRQMLCLTTTDSIVMGTTTLTTASPSSCEDARRRLVAEDEGKNDCSPRWPDAKEGAKQWIGTASCPAP